MSGCLSDFLKVTREKEIGEEAENAGQKEEAEKVVARNWRQSSGQEASDSCAQEYGSAVDQVKVAQTANTFRRAYRIVNEICGTEVESAPNKP